MADTRVIAQAGGARVVSLSGGTVRLTSSTPGLVVDVLGVREIVVVLHVSHASGTSPTLDVKIQDSADGWNWVDLGDAFTQVTSAPNTQRLCFAAANNGYGFARYIRAYATVGGTDPVFDLNILAILKT